MSVTAEPDGSEFGPFQPIESTKHAINRGLGFFKGWSEGVRAAGENGRRGVLMADVQHVINQVVKAHDKIRKQQQKIIDEEIRLVDLHKQLLEISRKHGLSVKQTLDDLSILGQRRAIERRSQVIDAAFKEIGTSIANEQLVREGLAEALDRELKDDNKNDAELISGALSGTVEDEYDEMLDKTRYTLEKRAAGHRVAETSEPPTPTDPPTPPQGYPVYHPAPVAVDHHPRVYPYMYPRYPYFAYPHATAPPYHRV